MGGVSGCRLVNADDSVIWDEQPVVYPNPANSSISINIPSRVNEVRVDITNVSGVNVFLKTGKFYHS